MKIINRQASIKALRLLGSVLAVTALCACSSLGPPPTPTTDFYLLDSARVTASIPPKTSGPTLIVNPPIAAAGFDSPRIIYVRDSHKLEYFAHSEWVDPPARMLGPLLVAALANTSAFGAVVLTPGAAAGDLRLDTEIIRLQHEFQSQPSRVRFTLRAILVEDRTRRVVAWREFDGSVAATSEDPYGGVVAANQIVQKVVEDLSSFCVDAMRTAQ